MLVHSFDIDGTLTVGKPSGIITRDMILGFQESGDIIGSCSQNYIYEQMESWNKLGVIPDFMISKDYLFLIKRYYPNADRYIHYGDWIGLDDKIAEFADFEFVLV